MLLRNPALTASLLSATTKKLCNHRCSTPAALMASSGVACSLLVLCGKSLAENETAKAIKTSSTLKLPEDEKLSLVLHSEMDNSVMQGFFQVHSYMDSLSTNQFGRLLIWSPDLNSTHDIVSHNFCELPIGTVSIADVQTKGRGRSKNVWESPLGCLMFSFTMQMEDGRVVPLVQYVVSLAMTEAIKDICDKNGLPSIDVRIKWPNDLYLNGCKVGGILCTSTYKSKKFNVSAGFQTLEELYIKTWLHSGQRVVVQEKNEDKVIEHVVTIQGLTSSGYLLAVGDDNHMCELHPDGNSFDFFKGLVRRKLQ
ncbi:Biotin--protein ligase 1, chloroplastic [Glycine max]|uniref:BPL/LPL catalytic domain-containing protein n=1 Tax=Glycine max TaxID=3847 RepID=A0A0R0JF72_SOYBN|nr:biotin--protein ligase 1, chloroplastic isoform X2 [Glycine max]KAH1245324.1 Biotin--protein ligase 1, chloroplastic [Glycine max]|eukprot:XP_006581574.1 biotin--protein ligase 1, chloroplastic isoform X2 [Glycine max]